LELADRVVEKYPWTILGKSQDGGWRFVCAVESEEKAKYLADALTVGQGMETKVEKT
jgi:hypothetical protein